MHFEQSNGWARFQQAVGKNVYMVSPSGVVPFSAARERRDGEGIAVEKCIIGSLKFLEINGWTLPSGNTLQKYEQVLLDIGKRVDAVFVRWTPPWKIPNPKSQILKLDTTLNVTIPQILVRQVPPRATLLTDLTKSEEELLNDMHEKTRYNIHLSERKGVVARSVNAKEGFASFWQLMQDTAHRDKIGIHPEEYYRKMLELMEPYNKDFPPSKGETERGCRAHLFIATFGNTPLASAILITCGDTATYLHGGSSSMDRNLMAPHLLQWKMMQFAKDQGTRWYDMWGVAPEALRTQNSKLKTQNYSWAGITRFKMGFGGKVQEGAGTYDVVCKPFVYKLLSAAQSARSFFTR